MTLNRREFLVNAGVLAAAGGCGRLGVGPAASGPYDVCVIGSGFAGTHLALRTAEWGYDTLLIEAGSSPQPLPDEHSLEESFKFSSSGEIRYPVNGTRAIAVGGTSRHWGGVATRLWPHDFRMKSEFGLYADWPISFEDLEPYYCEAERLLSVKGHAREAAAEPARDCAYPDEKDGIYRSPDAKIEGREAAYFSVPHSRRNGHYAVRLSEEEIPRFVESPRGRLLEDRQVTNLVTLDGKTIDHAEAKGLDGTVLQIRARYFVLAAGVVESARLLLLSRSSWFPTGLGNGSDLVGRFLNTHPSLQTKFELRGGHGFPQGYHRTCSLNDDFRREGVNASQFQLDVLSDGNARWKVQPEIEPRFENRVALSDRTDAFGLPLPDIHFGYSERDLKTIDRGRQTIEQAKEMLANPDGKMRDHDRWRSHPAGTCRMAADRLSGVVDPQNKVFGVGNLFVSGASTFPTSGTANPTDTVVAMTLRLADHLRQLL